MGGGSEKLINSCNLFKDYDFNFKQFESFTEQELVENIRKGDELSENYLYVRYSFIIKKIVSSFFILGGDKDDLFQEAMIGLINAVDKYNCNISSNFRCYAELCIRRQIITAVRKSARYGKNLLNNSISIYECINDEWEDNLLNRLEDLESCFNPENVIISKEEMNNYYDIKSRVLSKLEKAVLSEYETGKTYEEISIALKKDIKSIDNALQRIKRKINSKKETMINMN